MNTFSHVLLDGRGCPGFCVGHDPSPGVRTTLVHKGRAMPVGGVSVYPAIVVGTTPDTSIVGPRLRIVLDGGGQVLTIGMGYGRRMAQLLDLAGDPAGLANAVRVALAVLADEQQAADGITAGRRERAEAAHARDCDTFHGR